MPVYSLGAWAIDQSSPPDPALRHGCNFLPGVPHPPRFRLQVSPPGVSWPPSFSLPLGIPCQCLSCDASCRFSQRVTNPTPFSSFYFYFYWQLICLGPYSVVTDFDHFTFMILRRHLFTNVCILFTVCLVIIHVSELYNRTDLTLELNILILVFSLIRFDFQILLSMRKATRAFWIRALVSSSVPPVLLILLPRYVKQSVSSSGFPPTVTTFLLFVLAFIILVLFILMLSPVCADTRFSRFVFSCICT